MSLASWFRLPKFSLASPVKPSRSHQPLRSRVRVEQLEDRMLLAGGVNQAPFLNNPSATFNTQQIGQNPPTPLSSSVLGNNPLAVTQPVNGMQFPLDNGVAIGAQANLLAQGQVNGQFRAFGVNSQGQSGTGQQPGSLAALYLTTAMGFGSGVMPNAPWMPAAYNLGLANHQFNSPAQTDRGFQATPPWTHRFTYPVEETQPQETELPNWLPDALLKQLTTTDPEQDDSGDQNEIRDQPEEKAAPVENTEQNEPTETDQFLSNIRRGDAAMEQALFTEPLHTLAAATLVHRREHAAQPHPGAKHLLDGNDRLGDGRESENGGIPSSLWISALAPAQMAALVVGMPGVEAPANAVSMGSATGAAE